MYEHRYLLANFKLKGGYGHDELTILKKADNLKI